MPSAIQQSKYSDNVREEPNEYEQQTFLHLNKDKNE